MVALYNGFTHDDSAHTSYLFIVKDRFLTDRISQISPAQNRCSVSFRSSPHRQTLVSRISTPVLERAAYYIC